MEDFRNHPFAKAWFVEGVIVGMDMLHQLELIEVAKEHVDVAYMATEIALHRAGLGRHNEVFMDSIIRKGQVNQTSIVIQAVLNKAEAILCLTEEGVKQHMAECGDPNCQIAKRWKKAQEVAENALGLKSEKQGGKP